MANILDRLIYGKQISELNKSLGGMADINRRRQMGQVPPEYVPGQDTPSPSRAPASIQFEPLGITSEQVRERLMGIGGPTPEEKQMQQDLSFLVANRLQNQRDQIEGLKREFEKAKEGGSFLERVNLGPLSHWIDFLNDGKTNMYGMWRQTSGYQTPTQRRETIAKMQEVINKAEDRLTGHQVDLLKESMKQMGKQRSDRLLASLFGGEENRKRRDVDLQIKISEDADQSINKNVLTNKYQEDAQVFQTLETNLTPDPDTGVVDVQTFRANLGPIARLVSAERGVLTNDDIRRVVPSNIRASWAAFKAWFAATPTADLPKGFEKKLLQMVTSAKKNYVRLKMNRLLTEYRNSKKKPQIDTVGLRESVNSKFKNTFDELERVVPDWNVLDAWEPHNKSKIPVMGEFFMPTEREPRQEEEREKRGRPTDSKEDIGKRLLDLLKDVE